MSTLFIQDTTLTAIANAIRAKGSSALAPTVKVVRTPNTWGFGENDYRVGSVIGIDNVNGASSYEVTIEGAAKLKIKLSWALKGSYAGGTLKVWSGKITDATSTYIVNNDIYKKINAQEYECNGDTVSFATTWNSSHNRLDANIYGFYAEVTGYDANGNQICNGNPLKEIYYSEGYYETGGIPANTALNEVITIPGATKLEFIDYSYYSPSTCQMGYSAGVKEAPTGFQSNLHCDTVISAPTNRGKSYLLENTDTITVNAWCKTGQTANYYGIYFEVIGYDADGNVILEGGAPATYTPLEMPAAILAISGEGGGGITPEGEIEILENGDYDVTTYASAHVAVPVGIFPEGTFEITENGEYSVTTYDKVSVDVASSGGGIEVEPIVLTGAQPYGCSGAMSSKYIEMFGDTITTNKLEQTGFMFENATLTRIPFSLNYNNSSYRTMQRMFGNCYNLVEVPVMTNVYPDNINGMFAHCHCLRELPENFGADWNWNRLQSYTYGYMNNMFENCYSLRKIPASFLSNLWGIHNSAYYSPTYYTFSNCYTLDELRGFPVQPVTLTSNLFAGFVNACYRLEALTFATNEDGSPKTANWKSQVIDFTYVGYVTTGLTANITKYNSGITTATQVTDDTTYQALKNDPDWWTASADYSRYNHDSAVETINSLPDCSASGGTNTIKFKGAAGAKTDGGAINTMTDAEVAVAAAKGWTVTFI